MWADSCFAAIFLKLIFWSSATHPCTHNDTGKRREARQTAKKQAGERLLKAYASHPQSNDKIVLSVTSRKAQYQLLGFHFVEGTFFCAG